MEHVRQGKRVKWEEHVYRHVLVIALGKCVGTMVVEDR